MIASAGYWLASQADMVVATRGAEVGSIGVYCAFFDLSEYYNKLGVSVEVFSSGDYKGAGYPGTSLTKKQRADMDASIKRTHDQFAAAIQAARPQVSMDVMDGRVFDAEQAIEHGLIDDIVGGIEDAARMALAMANS
jgi:ClpP class serine protease